MNTKSLYIQILEKCWNSSVIPVRTTLKIRQESRTQSDPGNRHHNHQEQIQGNICHLRHTYYLERRFFL
ncbi:MAG: hypothetical protein AB1589_13595 [Cyanobacteriota bacterium]